MLDAVTLIDLLQMHLYILLVRNLSGTVVGLIPQYIHEVREELRAICTHRKASKMKTCQ